MPIAARPLSPNGLLVRSIPFLIWLYFAAVSFADPASPIWQRHFFDSDDYLYLVQALDWVKGGGWFDIDQLRIDPPGGMLVHFSPLMKFVYGAPIWLLSHWLSLLDAATATAAAMPLLYFAAFLGSLCWAATPITGKDWAPVTSFIALFATEVTAQFAPGRVDHHGLEALFAVTAFGFAARMMLREIDKKAAIGLGVTLALALAIAREFLPVFLIFSAWIGVWTATLGGNAARTAFAFGVALLASSFGFLLLTKTPAHLFDVDAESYALVCYYSVFYVALAAGIATCLGCVRLAASLATGKRLALGAGCAALAALIFFRVFPQISGGLYGGVDPLVIKIIIGHAEEALPLERGDALLAFAPLLSLAAFWGFWRKENGARWAMGLALFLIVFALLFAVFAQSRLMVYAQALSIIPLALLVKQAWLAAPKLNDRMLTAAIQIGAVLLVGPLMVVVFPAAAGRFTQAQEALFFPVPKNIACNQEGLISLLNGAYADRLRLIMNAIGLQGEDVELLFRTPHEILAAPFHQDIGGNIDSYRFFAAENAVAAEDIIRGRKADLVVLCRKSLAMYDGDNGGISLTRQLIEGKIPAWLKPVAARGLGDMLVFEVTTQH